MPRRSTTLLLPFCALITGCFDFDMQSHNLVTMPVQPVVSDPPASVTPTDVAGTWYVRTENNAVNCGAGEYIDAQAVVITQDNTDVSMLMSTGDVFTGSVDGDIVEWSGSFLERDGTSEYTSATLVVSADTGAGNAAWTWSDGIDSCNGTMAIVVARDIAAGESDGNSIPESAESIEFTNNVAFISGSLGGGGDSTDYFKFTPVADGVVQVELSHFDTQSTDLDLLLQDENLDRIIASRNVESFELVEAPVLAGKDYYIRVKARSISAEDSYILSIDIN